MSKVIKKRFTCLKDKTDKIIHILNERKVTADVSEFIYTAKFTNNVLDDFLKTKSKERPNVPDEGIKIEQLLKEYEDLLTQLVSSGRFLRFFTSNRVKKRLDQLNSSIFKEAFQISNGLQTLKKKPTKKSTKDSDDNLLDCMHDLEAKELWGSNFGQIIMVEWKEFINMLKKAISVDDETAKHLQYVLDNSNTNYVSMFKFADFLTGFGPLKTVPQKIQSIINADWFHGFLSSSEAERLLERQPPGTFLIRFSKSKSGSFAIAYVDASQRNSVIHTLIISCPPSGFKIEEAYARNARGRLFASLTEVVEFYSYILQQPFRSDLVRQSWFHGDLTSQEAEEILSGEKEGSFLFRFSSKSGFLAVSYISGGQIQHGLLECLSGGYRFDNQPPIYPTLHDVVANLKQLLINPITNLTFESNGNRSIDISKLNLGSNSVTDSNYSSFVGIMKGTIKNPPTSSHSNYNSISTEPVVIPQNQTNYASITLPSVPQSTITPTNAQSHTRVATVSTSLEPNPGPSPVLSVSPHNQPTNPQQYGSMPNPVESSSYHLISSVSSNIGALASKQQPIRATGPYSQQPSSQQNSSSEYQQINAINPTPNMQYGKMPVNGSLNSQKPIQQHGKILSPGTKDSPQQSQTKLPTNNQYGKMPTPATHDSPQQSVVTANSSPQQYGKMPTPATNDSPQQSQTKLPTNDQYGKMPTPATNDQYGKMPTPVTNDSPQQSQTKLPTNDQYGKMPTPDTNNSPQQSVAIGSSSPQQYGRMPSNSQMSNYVSIQSIPPKGNTLPPSPKLATKGGSPNVQSPMQYVSIPSPINNRSVKTPDTNLKPFVQASPTRVSTPSQYASIIMPQSVANKSDSGYGSLPQTVKQDSGYGSLPQTVQQDSGYGSLPQTVQQDSGYGSLPQTVKQDSGYGSLPQTVKQDSGYGSLPQKVQQDSGYGSLPQTVQQDSGYGSLPQKVQQDSGYGSLPQTVQQDSGYGSLPQTVQQDSGYGSLPQKEEGISWSINQATKPPRENRLSVHRITGSSEFL